MKNINSRVLKNIKKIYLIFYYNDYLVSVIKNIIIAFEFEK
jgi:hypothetical protein